jgi:hypothetical protein
MLRTDSSPSSPCGRAVALRDYAFDELPPDERREMELHLAGCGACGASLDRLRLLTATLRTVPDREIPQRIAFVSDPVFEPSWFRQFWNSKAPLFQSSLGFASACVLALAMVVSVWRFSGTRRPVEVRTVVLTTPTQQGVSQQEGVAQEQIRDAVAKAVAQVRAEDARMMQTAIQSSERKLDLQYRNQMVAIQENLMFLQKKLNTSYANYASLASSDVAGTGAGQ